jgi:membrane-associated phospholipid phosphatase
VRSTTVAAASALAFGLLLALVLEGTLTGVDRYAVLHFMPWLRPSASHLIQPATLFIPGTRPTIAGTLVALWTYPASPLLSALVVAGCAYALERRGARRIAVTVVALWIAANAVELAAKAAIARPSVGVAGFRHSFPSGHMLRASILAAAVAWTWRRAGAAVVAWTVTVAVALVALGDHTPTDVIGGLLLSTCLIATAQTMLRRARR